MLKVGLLGAGGISGAHMWGWKEYPDAEVIAVCDIRPEMLEKYPDTHHYSCFEDMVKNEQLDIVDICLPTYLHAEYSIKALNLGINVLCEKPISLNRDDVAKIYSAAENNGVKFMVAHVLRFWPEYDYIKRLVENGQFGKILSGKMTRISSIPIWSWDGWMQDEKRCGLVPYDLHIHDLDWLVYVFGIPDRVQSSRVKRPDQDSFSAIYNFGDLFVNCESAWYAGKIPFEASFRFQFENAVVVNAAGKMIAYKNDGQVIDLAENNDEKSDFINLPKTNAYADEIRYFADCVLNNKDIDIIKPYELENVINILNNL